MSRTRRGMPIQVGEDKTPFLFDPSHLSGLSGYVDSYNSFVNRDSRGRVSRQELIDRLASPYKNNPTYNPAFFIPRHRFGVVRLRRV